MNEIFITKDALISRFAAAIDSPEQVSYSFLIGAGFSRSAGVPLAKEIVGILSSLKCAKLQRKPRKASELPDLVKAVLQKKFTPEEAIQQLTTLVPALAGLDYSKIYTQLFDDRQLFPNDLRSQASFIAELLSSAEHISLGWNFESLYLGFLCSKLHNHPRFSIDTILTTNFDNILTNSFSHLGARFRVLDHPQAIADESFKTRYPRLLYLHGRYIHYRVINSDRQIMQLIEGARDERRSQHPRYEAINKSLHHASEGGGLIVIGYDGWEDAVMKVLGRELGKESAFDAGVVWCHYEDRTRIRPELLKLAQETRRIEIVENVSALDVMRILLEAAAISESEVIRRLRTKGASEYTDIRRRWISVQEKRHGMVPLLIEEGKQGPSVSLIEVEKVCEKAFRDSRYSALAFQLLQERLSNIGDTPVDSFADLLRWRAELRVLYSGKPELAIADFYAAAGLSPANDYLVFLGLSDAYRQLGEFQRANLCLNRAYSMIVGRNDPLGVARCQLMDALIRFDLDTDLYNAENLCNAAMPVFEKHGRKDLRSKCFGLLASMCGFNNQGIEGLGFAEMALQDAQESQNRIMECKAREIEGYCLSGLGDFEKAARAFEAARAIAVEGPQYRVLANIDVHLSDVRFCQEDTDETFKLLSEAIEYFTFIGDAKSQEEAILTRQFDSMQMVNRSSLEEVAQLALGVLAFERFGDEAQSASQWLLVVAVVVRLKNRRNLADVVSQATDRAHQLAMNFESKWRASVGQGDRDPNSRERHTRLVSHVWQQALVAQLLAGLRMQGAVDEDEDSKLKKVYGDLIIHCRFGYASRVTEVLVAILAYTLFRRTRISSEILPKFRDIDLRQSSANDVQAFCSAKGYWSFRGLVE